MTSEDKLWALFWILLFTLIICSVIGKAGIILGTIGIACVIYSKGPGREDLE